MKIVINLVKIIVVFVCFTIPFLSYSGIAYPSEWHTDDGMTHLVDKDYQLAAQMVICQKAFPNNINKQKACFAENVHAYGTIMNYLRDTIGNFEGQNMEMKSCIGTSLDNYWISSIDSCAWILILNDSLECVEE